MATIEKLTKALEALKVVQPPGTPEEAQSQKKKEAISKKEKILHCSTIADAICSHNLRSTPDFPKVLGFAVETFLLCCDDNESDVRLMADECLNRTIKTLLDSHLNRLQVELYKEIKKDGAARSLRAALIRFAELCHRIRPEKLRPYAVNLLPCLAKICQRVNEDPNKRAGEDIGKHGSEELVQETLAIAVAKIMPVLGLFTTDKEVKMLLKAFLGNLTNGSATVRRASASSLIAVCEYSRRPSVFYCWLLTALFDMILPVQDDHSVASVLGVLLCLRHLVPHLSEPFPQQSQSKFGQHARHSNDEMSVTSEQLCKVYEVCLYFTCHPDHNVITATLETLYQLLKNASKDLQQVLISPDGITKSLIYTSEMNKLNRSKSESQSSVLPAQASFYDDSALEEDQDVYLPEKSDEEKPAYFGDAAKSSFDQSDDFQECDSEDMPDYPGIKLTNMSSERPFSANIPGVHNSGTPKKVPPQLVAGDDKLLDEELWGDQNSTPSPSTKLEFKVGNIGTFTDHDVPLKYCARLLCSSFLLPGMPGCYMPDRNVRVSVKSLALGCLSCVVSLYPQALFLELHSTSDGPQGDAQRIWDVFMYTSHPDPHLKGQCAVVIGAFISNALRKAGGWWDKWIAEHGSADAPPIQALVSKISAVVQDASSVSSRLGLSGLKLCLGPILQSMHAVVALPVLEILLSLKDNTYWLTKVELLDLISDLSFSVIQYLESKKAYIGVPLQATGFQSKLFRDVLIPLLGDEDFRVRQACATAVTKIVPQLFFPLDHPYQDPIISLARQHTSCYLDFHSHHHVHSSVPLAHALVKPFCDQDSVPYCAVNEAVLTRILSLLIATLNTSTNKHLLYGCCQTLCLLSETFTVTVYTQAWKIAFGEETPVSYPKATRVYHQHSLEQDLCSKPLPTQSADLFNHMVALLTHTTVALDLLAHQHALQLIGNLICGAFYHTLQEKHRSSEASTAEEQKSVKEDNFFSSTIEQVFVHLMRLLNIFAHVLDELPLVLASTRPALPSLPNAPSLSPIKRKGKAKEENPLSASSQKGSPTRVMPEKPDVEKDIRPNIRQPGSVGHFQSSPLYVKLYAILKGAHASYKISVDFQSNEKFCQLLKCTLVVLSQVLEITETQEMSKHAEEILCYLKSLMSMEPCSSVQCVRQLLKSLFGTNLVSLYQGMNFPVRSKKPSSSVRYSPNSSAGLYHTCIGAPYGKLSHCLINKGVATDHSDEDEVLSSLSWMKRSDRLTNLLKSGSKVDKANLAAHIKLFEGVVIKALKLYTITSNVNLQCQVLDLLAQLVQLRVNYCLLDSDQIFIGFILKQFEYIEEGQIQQADILIPRIFYFLVLLSYERYHSKSIMSVPRILQLCDGLIASGQPPERYVIKALQPVVEDLFLVRGINKVDLCKDLDAQREVVIFTLFKLAQYAQVCELFLLIVNQTFKEGEDKWKKISREVVDALLPLLARQQLQVDNEAQMNTLHRLLEAVASNVYRPVDILLKALFTRPKDLNQLPNLHRWVSMVLALLRIIIVQTKEEVMLSRMSDMGITVEIYKLNCQPEDSSAQPPVPALTAKADSPENQLHSASVTFARFLFQAVGIASESIYNNLFASFLHQDNKFLCQLVAHMLLYMMHMFQCGTFRKVTAAAMELAKQSFKSWNSSSTSYYSVSDISSIFLALASTYPTLVVEWCNILMLLNCDCQKFWSQILVPNGFQGTASSLGCKTIQAERSRSLVFHPCNSEVVRRAGVALLCDYVCENPNDAELMTLLIVDHVNDLIHLSVETTVQDFISAVHRNSAASGLLIQAVNARCSDLSQPVFLKRALCCLETIHSSQSGNLLTLLMKKFLPTHHVVIARNCDNLACRRIEIMLTDPSSAQVDDIDELLEIAHSSGIYIRHQWLASMLERLKQALSPDTSAASVHPLAQVPNLQKFEFNKERFLKYVKELCFSEQPSVKECALLLSHLKYEDAVGIMSAKEFQLPLLERSLKLGAQLTLSSEKCTPSKSNDPFLGIKTSSESPLYRAARSSLLLHITNLIALLPRSFKHQNRIQELFDSDSFWELLCHIVSATTTYLRILREFDDHQAIPEDSLEDIARLNVLCCEAISWLLTAGRRICTLFGLLQTSLTMLNDVLRNPQLFSVFVLPENITWTLSCISAMHQLVMFLQPSPTLTPVTLPEHLGKHSLTPEQVQAQKACIQMAEIVGWLEHSRKSEIPVPQFIQEPLIGIIQGLARLPLVNSFARTPPILWNLGWGPEFTGDYKTLVPPPPGEHLQDRDVLKQYIFRVNLLGWISRQQFEETWMALLGVLSATPVDEVEGKEEDQEHIRTSCLAVKSITSLLLQTLLLPEPGNPQNSTFLMQPRNKPLAFLHTKCGKKLMNVRGHVHRAMHEIMHNGSIMNCCKNDEQLFNTNAERVTAAEHYSLSQVSLEYLCTAAGFLEENDEADESASSNSSPLSSTLAGAACHQQREQSLATAGLDIHSCLHFLLDLYSQWLSPVACPYTPLTLLTEVVRSVVMLSDIFMERTQFEWLLDTLLEVQRVHPAEDEIISQYLIIGICKAAAVLGMEQDILERLKKLLELNLKSTFLPTQISTLHGLLFLLQQGAGDDALPILSTASEYILKHLKSFNTFRLGACNKDHLLVMIAVAFYMMENFQEDVLEFSQKFFQVSLNICGAGDDTVPMSIHLAVFHGLERLLVSGVFSAKDVDLLLKLAVDRIASCCSVRSLSALGVMLSCVYIGKSNSVFLSSEAVSGRSRTSEKPDSAKHLETDNLIAAFERATVLFERIRKGYPLEAEVICQVLPPFLMEFFPVQDVLNKVIGEFLSSQQPHPQLIAGVIFEVFQYLHRQSYEDVIQDWVMLSLSNFTQRSPMAMAIWSLSCFLVSSTSNSWLQAIFPYIQSRMGKIEEQDKILFCVAGLDFRNSLKEEEQKQAYFSTIQAIAQNDTPYADLLSCL